MTLMHLNLMEFIRYYRILSKETDRDVSPCLNGEDQHYSVNSFMVNVICYITIPSLNKVLYLVSCILYQAVAVVIYVSQVNDSCHHPSFFIKKKY